MPIYEYKCLDCGKHHEIMRKITDRPLTKCPACGGKMKKMISNTSFVLKGTGWYATDYASDKNKKDNSSGKTHRAESSKTEKKKDSKPETKKDTKPETKKEARPESKPLSKETSAQK